MVFVTVGSQRFQFNRLIKAVDDCKAEGTIADSVFVQTGYSDYKPKHLEAVPFLSRDAFAEKLDECNVVITHGGTGVIVNALKLGKRVIAMPRLASEGEHVDNHQEQLLKSFVSDGLIATCFDRESLASAYANVLEGEPAKYKSDNTKLLNDLDAYLAGSLQSDGISVE